MFAHAPALRLLEALGLAEHIDEVWGTSAGALAGLLYAHGLSPAAIEQTGYDLYTGRYSLALAPSRFQLVRNLVREAFVGASHTSQAGFVDSSRNLSRMLERYCHSVRPVRSFYALAFNLSECRSQVLTPDPVPAHLDPFVIQTDAVDCALASSAVPVLFMPKSIRRHGIEVPYIDGSTTEDVPLASVIRKWDSDRAAGVETRHQLLILFVKLTHGTSGFQTRSSRLGKVRLLQTIASVGMETMHQQNLALAQARSDVRLLPLELREPSPDFFELRRIPEYVRRAKEVYPAQLEALEQRLRAESSALADLPPVA
jgi:predicted acylesterase/phospholipase RssA